MVAAPLPMVAATPPTISDTGKINTAIVKDLEEIKWITQAVVLHDKRAFGRLVERYQEPVRRFFLTQTLGDATLSDDLAQDTFVKAYTHIGAFRRESTFGTWLYRIAYNVYYDHVKRQHPNDPLDSRGVMTRSAQTGDGPLRMDLQQALGILGPTERACMVLQLMEGQPIDRIAQIMDMPGGTVKSHLARGKKKLADYLKQNGYDR